MSKNKKLLIITLTTLAIALVLGVFRTYLLVNYVEYDTGFYVLQTNIGDIFKLLCIVFCAAIVVAALTIKKERAPEKLSSQSTFVVFTSSLCGFVFLTVFGCGMYEMISGNVNDMFMQATILLCVPSMLNFFFVCSKEQRKNGVKQTILALFPPIFYAIRLISTFVDKTTQINTSQRSLEIVFLCAIMLMLLYEAEYLIPNNEKTSRSVARHYAFCLFSFAFAIISAVPYIAVCSFWVYEAEFLLMNILDVCVGIYAFSRAITMAKEK